MLMCSSTSPQFICTSDSSWRVRGTPYPPVFYFQSGASALNIDVIQQEACSSQICCYSDANIRSKGALLLRTSSLGHLELLCSQSASLEKKKNPIIRLHPPAVLQQMSFPRPALRRLMNANGSHLPGKATVHETIETVLLHLRPRRRHVCPD